MPIDPDTGRFLSQYTQEIAIRFCTAISEGKSLRSVCKIEGMPSKPTVFEWLRDNPEFARLYQIACEERAEGYAEEIVDIADDGTNDYVVEDGMMRFNSEHVQRSKLRVEARKWIACKLKPKKYGDKLALGGASDLPPMQVSEIVIRAVNAAGDRPPEKGG